MRSNTRPPSQATHFGGVAGRDIKPLQQLERQVATCLLGESTFYETGKEIAASIEAVAQQVKISELLAVALKAKDHWHLRHAPLLLVAIAAKRQSKEPVEYFAATVEEVLADIIRRPDELAEFLAIYWRNGKCPLSARVKRGLARAFTQFDEYQLAKWNRMDKAIKLRDVLFLCHAKPTSKVQEALWKSLIDGTLPSPDTWEVGLSTGGDKKGTFERLLREEKLGYMALLSNLRNMEQAGVDSQLVNDALLSGAARSRMFPYRFITAAKHAPSYAGALNDALLLAQSQVRRLKGKTLVLVDVSGSMRDKLSAKSESTRMDAACGVACLAREVAEHCRVFTFSNNIEEVPNLRGLGLVRGILESQEHKGTYLSLAIKWLEEHVKGTDRLIVITDEQADSLPPHSAARKYIINVAPYKPGLPASSAGYTRINGWSDRVVDWIQTEEDLAPVHTLGSGSEG